MVNMSRPGKSVKKQNESVLMYSFVLKQQIHSLSMLVYENIQYIQSYSISDHIMTSIIEGDCLQTITTID